MRRWAWRVCNKVWKREGSTEEWKEGIIIAIIKKRRGEAINKYRGVILMPATYKIYAIALVERLRRKVEEKKILY